MIPTAIFLFRSCLPWPVPQPTSPLASGAFLDLVRRLIEYGKELATSLQQRSPATDLASVQRAFGTSNISRILASITRGRPRRRPTPPNPVSLGLPTREQIATEVRSRPIGAVIANICREVGILPSHPPWRDLQLEIVREDGNLAALVSDLTRWAFRTLAQNWPASALPPSPAPSRRDA